MENSSSQTCLTSTGTHVIWDQNVTFHLGEVTLPHLPQIIKAGTRYSDLGKKQGWVHLVGWLHTRVGYLLKDGHSSHHSTNWAWHRLILLMQPTTLRYFINTTICYMSWKPTSLLWIWACLFRHVCKLYKVWHRPIVRFCFRTYI